MAEHALPESAETTRTDGRVATPDDAVGARPAAPVRIQRKLVVGSAADPAEREADRLADLAVAAIRSGRTTSDVDVAPETSRIARRATGADGFEVDAETQRGIESARGGGQALPTKIRRSMEGAFGADFSGVRLHVGDRADVLNERVQARAFTLGNDVFVRRSDYAPGTEAGRHLLAHELAHTVQQGASRIERRTDPGAIGSAAPSTAQRVVRRSPALDIVNSVRGKLDTTRQLSSSNWFDPAKFKEATNTRGHQRGAALKAIDKYLAAYAPIASDPAKHAERLKLLVQMQYAAEQWILDHAVKDGAGSRALKKDRKTGQEETVSNEWLIDPNRKGRFAGMAYFLENVDIAVRNTKTALADTDTDDQTREKVEQVGGGATSQHTKLKAKYEGDPTSVLTKLGALVEMAVPNEGDQSEISVDFRWPVDPTGQAFVGGSIRLSAQNASPPGAASGGQGKKNILARAEVVFTFGGQWINVAKLQAEVGGYIEASAKTGRETMTLMSYLLYRRCRESYVMPREITSYLWGGGRKGTFGAIKSENWSKDVEERIIGDNDQAYAQSGLIAGVGADGKFGNKTLGGGVGGKISGGTGTRYDKKSIETAKGQLGADNVRSDKAVLSTAQKELGRNVRFMVIEAEGNVGPFSGAIAVRLQWEQNAGVYALEGAELEFSAGAKVPNVGGEELGQRIAGWATEGVKTLVSKIRAVVGARADKQKVAQGKLTKKEQGEAKKGSIMGEIFGPVVDGLDQLRNVKSVETLANPSPATDPTWLGGAADPDPSNFHSQISNSTRFNTEVGNRSLESTIGLVMSLGGDLMGKVFQLTFSFEKERTFSIPMFLDITQKGTSRVIAFRKESTGPWEIL